MNTQLSRHWYHQSRSEVEALLESSEANGLDIAEIENRQAFYGPNRLTLKRGKSRLVLFLLQFHHPLIYILLGATVITFVLQEWVDSGVIFGVVLVNAVIGFIQESNAIKAIQALARTMEVTAVVIRAGKKEKVAASELVPGDLVLLQSGDKVPADIRLLRSRELQVDESALTGESVPVQKQSDQLLIDVVLAERYNMVYSSTLITYGTGAGLVVETGDQTEIGRISTLIASAETLVTPLTKKIGYFSQILLWTILGLAGVTFLVGWMQGEPLLDTFMAAVALAVAAIPEGLPAAMAIMLAIGSGKMARRHAIIRKMPAVETLGSTTVICSDKTGTLTQNQMTVQQIYAGGEHFNISGVGYSPIGNIHLDHDVINPDMYPALMECLKAGLLCNDSRLFQTNGQWNIEGDPTEVALITAAIKAKLLHETFEQSLPRIDTLPFESQHQFMATLHDLGSNAGMVIFMKGSVESVLSRCCNVYVTDHESIFLNKDQINQNVNMMAEKGLRVLAFACKVFTTRIQSVTHTDVAEGFSFLGLQAMMDPPRKEVIAAIRTCKNAGISVKMITGDHVATAIAIAHQIGLNEDFRSNPEGFSVHGDKLSQLSDYAMVEVSQRATVFARIAPEQKLRLVKALQTKGNVVAMTGDGVNDAPALKQADIGVAMGKCGTEVAKESADVVLTDDNFATIGAAVEEGRVVFDNLIKFITWTLPTSIGEGLVILLAILSGHILPITPVQILWINMTTALLLGLMLAFEIKEPGVMERPPRHPETPILTHKLAIRIGIVGLMLLISTFGLFNWMLQQGRSIEAARTIASNMLVFGEIFYLFNCRSLRYSIFRLGVFSNRWLLGGVALMILAQIMFTYSSTMNLLFGSAPLKSEEWILILTGGFFIYIVVDIEKWLRRSAI